MFGVSIARSKDIERYGEELIVDPSGVEGKAAHQKQQITHIVDIWQHLLGILAPNYPQGQGQDDSTVADVSEHHSEQEGEDGNGEKGGIYLLIARHTVSVDDFLERSSERVHFEVRRWLLFGFRLTNGDHRGQQLEQQSPLLFSNPNLGDERVVPLLQKVHSVEDSCLPLEQNAVGFEFRIAVVFI